MAKVIASVWGEEFIKFLVAPPVLPRAIVNNRMNCTRMLSNKRDEFILSSKSS